MTWYTIPDAPNYEINSKLICRNKKTGYVLKKHKDKNGHPYYSLSTGKKHITRSPKYFFRRAKAAAQVDTYEPIPSLDNKYEIDRRGHVRNVKTKLPIKAKCGGKCFCFQMSAREYVSRSLSDLLWEVHGKIIPRRFRPCPVFCEKYTGKFFFDNLRACARFLAPKIYLSWRTLANDYLANRRTEIQGWHITYLDKDPRYSPFALADVKGTGMRGDL